jgi:hypothetical protein
LSDGAGARIEVLGRLSATGPQPALTDANGLPLVRVRAGAGVSFVRFDGRAVSAIGTFYPGGELPLLVVDSVAALFDVQIGTLAFATVTLDPRSGTRSLAARVASGDGRFVARDCAPADAFRLPRGRSGWTLIACRGERFDEAWFDRARFDGGACNVAGVFDRSRFNAKKDGAIPHGEYPELSRFGPLRAHLSVSVKARWLSHVPGRFVVNLPADLPPKFGARFNEARFASSDTHSQTVAGVVFDPPSDPSFIVQALSSRPQVATLVTAQVVPFVPLGWEPASVPFRQPRTRYLSGGGPGRAAALYLQEHGVPGAMAIVASSSGVWGNDIAVSVSVAGPAVYDVTISYAAACFECAQRIVLDGRLPPKDASRDGGAADALAQGVARAKAAGIEAIVTRERT